MKRNLAIEEDNSAIQIEKLSIGQLKKAFLNKNYHENTKDKILIGKKGVIKIYRL